METKEKTVFEICEYRMPEFQAKIAKINKKAAKLGLPEVGYRVIGTKTIEACETIDGNYIPAYELLLVETFGEAPYIQGWALLGVLEFNFDLPLVHSVPGKSVPEKYWTDNSRSCDHCGMLRNRKETVILQNVETGEIKQVGKTCVCDFLPGASPESVAATINFYLNLDLGADDDEQWDKFCDPHAEKWSDAVQFDISTILRFARAVIRVDGWVSSTVARESAKLSSAETVKDLLCPPKPRPADWSEWVKRYDVSDADMEVAAKTATFINSSDFSGDTDYVHNLKVIFGLGSVNWRNIPIVVSAISCYMKHLDRVEEISRKKSEVLDEFYGVEKERLKGLELTVKSVQFWDSAYGTVTFIRFADAAGRCFVWKASGSRDLMEVGNKMIITGTIKKHDIYKGMKQTVLTRCKIETHLN